jgi:gamma-glutamyltranspeptidase/glutathione hydrolase
MRRSSARSPRSTVRPAPAGLTLELLQQRGFRQASAVPCLTVTVPGACAAWCDLMERHGRLPLAEVLGPAAELAERGFPVSPITAHFWALGAKRQLSTALGGQALTLDGRAPRSGEVFRNPGLARTLRAVAAGGRAAAGRSAGHRPGGSGQRRRAGGPIWRPPSSWSCGVHRLPRCKSPECGPSSRGLAALLLNILEGFQLSDGAGCPAPAPTSEALRLAFARALVRGRPAV